MAKSRHQLKTSMVAPWDSGFNGTRRLPLLVPNVIKDHPQQETKFGRLGHSGYLKIQIYVCIYICKKLYMYVYITHPFESTPQKSKDQGAF